MGKAVIPPLPEGFQIETPALPPGFQLENSPETDEQFAARTQIASDAYSANPAKSNYVSAGDIPNIGMQARPEAKPIPPTLTERLFAQGGNLPGQPRTLMPGAESLQWVEKNPDVALATAASVFAPELPIAYNTAVRLGPHLTGAARQILQIPYAFGGGTAGGAIKELNNANPQTEMSDMILNSLKSGSEQATAQTLGVGVGPILGKIFAPGLSSMTPESEALLNFAKEKNIPALPSTFSPNNTAKALESTTDAFFPSRLVNDAYRKKATIRFNQLMTELPEEVGPIQGNKVITPQALDEIGSFLDAKSQAGKELSKDFINIIGPTKVVPTTNTNAVLSDIKRTATDENLLKWITTKQAQLASGDVTAKELETGLRQVGGIKPQSDKHFLEDIRSAIKEDFQAAGAPMEKLAASNQAFKENYALISNKMRKALNEDLATGNGTKLTVELFRDSNTSFIKSLAEEAAKKDGLLSKETWESLKAQNLQNMIMNASKPNTKVMGLQTIDGPKLTKMIAANRGALEAAHADNPGTLEALDNLARLATATGSDTAAFEKGFGEALKAGNFATLLSAGGAALAGHVGPAVGLISGTATAPFLAKSMMNPNGWAKRWLTTGFDPVRTQEGLKMGGRLLFQDAYKDNAEN